MHETGSREGMSVKHQWHLSDFNYELPERLIAQKPAEPRDHAKLLVYDRATGLHYDDYFYNLPRYLPADTLLVLNNARVDKARLLFGNKEVFVVRRFDATTVEAMVRPGKKFKPGKTVALTDDIEAKVREVTDDGLRILAFNRPLDEPVFDPHRMTPFPPYIRQDESLSDQYQTVFAKKQGSKAAPTAGLHFTPRLFEELHTSGIDRTEITLHVGLGTFAPVKADRPEDHHMHQEEYEIPPETAGRLNAASHITAVGTTTARTLEGTKRPEGFVAERSSTDIFILPGYQFRAVDAMITNFHLPESTLLMMISAFAGYEKTMELYRHAIQQEYRFYSFGDAMLIL